MVLFFWQFFLRLGLLLLLFGLAATGRSAEGEKTNLLLAPIFSDGMILQRDQPVPVWGQAPAGAEVEVRVGGQEKKTQAGEDGRWTVTLDALTAGVLGDLVVQAGGQEKIIKDVLAGEVWFCAGQSNMAVDASNLAPEVLGSKEYDQIRLFTTVQTATAEPAFSVPGQWRKAHPAAAGKYSAIGYLVARDLHERLQVPVGMVQATWGDTRIENWMPLSALQSDPDFAPYVQAWTEASVKFSTVPDRQKIPSTVFNGMIAPLIPYGVKGILWYQGESNGWAGKEYRKLFPAMIQSWRKAWGMEAPFLYVQLPSYGKLDTVPPKVSPWSETREAQALALSLPKTGMAVTIDIGGESIHPANKPETARRLSLVVRAQAYGEEIVAGGPLFEKASFSSDRATVVFRQATGLKAREEGTIKGFALAGEDRKWFWAEATIEGERVVVKSAQVAHPMALRYAWAHNPENNLVNDQNLPVAPFRTDDW